MLVLFFYIFFFLKKIVWLLVEFDILCGIIKVKIMIIIFIIKVEGEVSIIIIIIIWSLRLIVLLFVEIMFIYLFDSLDWFCFLIVLSLRFWLLNVGLFCEYWMILWLIWVKSEYLRRDWEIVNVFMFYLYVNLVNVYLCVWFMWKFLFLCDIIRIIFVVWWVVGFK